jgi:hypothetical protein
MRPVPARRPQEESRRLQAQSMALQQRAAAVSRQVHAAPAYSEGAGGGGGGGDFDDAFGGEGAAAGGGLGLHDGAASPTFSEGAGRAPLVWNIRSRGSSIPSPLAGRGGGLSPQPRSPYHAPAAATAVLGGFSQ